jgi:hypothetical protein
MADDAPSNASGQSAVDRGVAEAFGIALLGRTVELMAHQCCTEAAESTTSTWIA